MITIHHGQSLPMLEEPWDPKDVDTVFFDWTALLDGGVITSSVWYGTSGLNILEEYQGVDIIEGGFTYVANGVLLACNPNTQEGPQRLSNTIKILSGTVERVYDRSVMIYILDR